MANGSNYGYDVPTNYGDNFRFLENQDKPPLTAKVIADNKQVGKYKSKLLLDMKEFQVRLKEVAKEEGKKPHPLAREFIIAGIKRLEKKHKKERFIDKQYSI